MIKIVFKIDRYKSVHTFMSTKVAIDEQQLQEVLDSLDPFYNPLAVTAIDLVDYLDEGEFASKVQLAGQQQMMRDLLHEIAEYIGDFETDEAKESDCLLDTDIRIDVRHVATKDI